MVVLYKCDICGTIVEEHRRYAFAMEVHTHPKLLGKQINVYIDVCEECVEKIFSDLKEWVASKIRTSSATE